MAQSNTDYQRNKSDSRERMRRFVESAVEEGAGLSPTREDLQLKAANHSRHISSARTLLNAGADGYGKALETGRLPAWEKMMHSIIDLLANVEGEGE